MAKIFCNTPPDYALSSLEAAVMPLKYHSGVLVPEEIWPV